MIRNILLIILITAFALNQTFAEDKNFGLGIILGEPTGISFKSWHNKNIAYDGAIAWSLGGKDDALHIHLDYLIHNFRKFKVEEGKLAFYYGIGGRIKLEDKSRLGVRVPLGFSYVPEEIPIDVFFEIVPVFDLVPETDLGLNGAIGCRYYF